MTLIANSISTLSFKALLVLVSCIVLTACSSEPRAINYGSDMCEYCKMTVVDQQHAAEIVTNKGRVYVFDAIECMIRHLEEDRSDHAHVLVNDYSTPSKLIKADEATYLISKGIPSPMGAFLTAFERKDAATTAMENKGGDLYSWKEIKIQFGKEHVESR